MPPISADQVAEIADAGFNLLREASDLTSGRDPNYIRDAQPANAIDAIALAAARQGCRRYQQKGGDYSGRRAARAERACRPYLDSLEAGTGPEIELPFRGGQCDAVYTINYTLNPNNAQATTGFLQARGPIRGIVAIPINGTTNGIFLQASGLNLSGSPNCRAVSNTGAGNYNLGSAPIVGSAPPRINSVTPCGLDNCGNTPPVFTPPKTPTTPLPPGSQPFTRSPDVDVDVDVTINPDFSININVGTGPVTIDPFADPPAGEPGGGGGPPPGDVGQPGAPSTPEPGGEAEGVAPDGSEIVGLRIQLLNVPPSKNQYTEEVYRGVYYVYMGVPGLLDHDPAGAMVRSDQFVFAEREGLTAWRVRANDRWSIKVTPYYREVE